VIINKINLPLNFEDDYWQNNFQDLRNYIYYTVGGGTVRVESHVNHYNRAIHSAIKKYYEWENLSVGFETLTLAGDKTAIIPENIEPSLISDVVFYGHGATFSQFQVTSGLHDAFFMREFSNPILAGGDVTQYMMARQKLKDIDRVLGIERSWEILGNKIKCYPVGMNEDRIGIVYGAMLLPEHLESDSWIQDYACEEFKHILGRIRTKFSGFQTSAGAATTDGESLISEAIAEKARLLEELKARRSPMMIHKL
jgi:hypothetical protein